jgi:hypothetical protein
VPALFGEWELDSGTTKRIRLGVNEKTAKIVREYRAGNNYEAVVKTTKTDGYTSEDVCPIAAEIALRGGQGLTWQDVINMANVLKTITPQTTETVLDDIAADNSEDQYCVCIIAIYNAVNEALQAGKITKFWLRAPNSNIGPDWTNFIEYDKTAGLKSSFGASKQIVASFRSGASPDDVNTAVMAYRDLIKALANK